MSIYTLSITNNIILPKEVLSRSDYLKILSIKGLIFISEEVAKCTANFLNDNKNKYSKIKLNLTDVKKFSGSYDYRKSENRDLFIVQVREDLSWNTIAKHNNINVYFTIDIWHFIIYYIIK